MGREQRLREDVVARADRQERDDDALVDGAPELEDSGLVVTRHGSGTFVTGPPADPAGLARLLATVRQAAHEAGVDPRDVAAALYVGGESAPPDPEAAERRRLRAQIAALEQTLSELAGRRPGLLPRADEPPSGPQPGPRLLDADGLTEQRDALVRRLADVQAALDARSTGPVPVSG